MYVLGLMSGTSADGVDASLVEFKGNPYRPKWRLVNSTYTPYSLNLREEIINCGQGLKLNSQRWLELAESITEFHALAARTCDPKGKAVIVGGHGQTVFHRPPCSSKRGASLQLLQAPLLATLLHKPVIYDFRAKDLALGGEGAPLVPLADKALLGRGLGWRGVLNIGGIANISLIPPRFGPDRDFPVLGWDCGPGNTLIDLAVQTVCRGKLTFDCNGLIASKGSPDLYLIEKWLEEPFFKKIPPKSTGRETFGLEDLDRRLTEMSQMTSNDLIATLTVFSACVIAQDLRSLYNTKSILPIELFVAGGGAKNPFLMREIASRCHGIKVQTIDLIGIPVVAREAIAFALLAWWNVLNTPGSSSLTTGVSRPVVLGTKATPN
ncbi:MULTISPECIES: anhydro-N-acetylmuramic acid kinase [Prochlorococcus]|uniref:anhydro-N-acetylmuramic acid kinase n=1 Tax=Prochlorococcus TaxID=1218 RepID=UPI0005339B92|nr:MULTISPECIES: anhydro-N-acetylmuramic acid kinase [Prochlorococcus]KGG13295.1 Anhydro-N-acetylmuramic acid kinase [Prochlorococcus sp. MIT 0601]